MSSWPLDGPGRSDGRSDSCWNPFILIYPTTVGNDRENLSKAFPHSAAKHPCFFRMMYAGKAVFPVTVI